MITAQTTANLLGKYITIIDARTGGNYTASIGDVKEAWGKMRIQLSGGTTWFEPTHAELQTVRIPS
jgi:hypothetical protein